VKTPPPRSSSARLADGSAKGPWDIPGGFLNAQDHLHDALIRECRREMGIEVRVGEVLGAFDEDTFHGIPLVTIVYVCTIAGGDPRPADLIDDVRWFALREPPQLAWPSITEAVAALQDRCGITP
jgi:8-oxo-dGTP diphosphatase